MASNWISLPTRVTRSPEMDPQGSFSDPHSYLTDLVNSLGLLRSLKGDVSPLQETGDGWRTSPTGRRSIVNTYWENPSATDVLRKYHTGLTLCQTIWNSNGRLEQARQITNDSKLVTQFINSYNMCLFKLGYCGKFYNSDGSHFCYCENKCRLAPYSLNLALEMFIISCFTIKIKSGDMISFEDDGSVFIPKGSELPLDQLHLAEFIVKSLGNRASMDIILNRKLLTTANLYYYMQRFCVTIAVSLAIVVKSSGFEIAPDMPMVLRLRTVACDAKSCQPGWSYDPP